MNDFLNGGDPNKGQQDGWLIWTSQTPMDAGNTPTTQPLDPARRNLAILEPMRLTPASRRRFFETVIAWLVAVIGNFLMFFLLALLIAFNAR